MRKFLFVLCFPLALQAQQPFADTARAIDKILNPWSGKNMPGVSIAISRNGQLVYANAVGMADLEHAVHNDTATIFEAGSVSKQFTAAAILLLEQQGKLSQQDDIRKFVPEMPDYGHPVRIYHLIHHLSGLRDWGAVAEVEGWPRSTRAHTNAHALQIMSRQKTLNNVPGAEYIYSNSNYNLMAIIVERVSGTSFQEFCRKHLFEPAGMHHTLWRHDYRQVVPRRAMAYQPTMTGFKTLMPFEDAHGNGGLLTTPADLVNWTAYIHAGKLGGQQLLQKQLERGRYNNGREMAYAAGLRIGTFNGQDLVTHSGATAGYRANLDYYPAQGLSIALLSNSSGTSPVDLAQKIAALFFPAPPTENSIIHSAKSDPVKLKPLAGWYRNTRSDEGILIAQKDSVLVLPSGKALEYLGGGRFGMQGYHLQFRNHQGRVDYFVVDQEETGDTVLFEAAVAPVVNKEYLTGFTGTFTSEEANATIRIRHGANGIQWEQLPTTLDNLRPSYRDGFEVPGGHIRFIRNSKKQVTGFHLSVGRARRILFRKL
ncbi:serine hydrolase domain-containing protein [Flavihumibacter stibioxidans]|uniref:Beta-lactamase-related domain-containing protein n=1 Tax=Flavihumibacter stibioxidans TaxID=1834163 RepID=A0ABR7M4X1_9BACT|nr:serine hydrolase domain-containing protein [Flavihumibacter stibioxidans]MBC6489711.1 hypothetical protein [Flavihumibacter stibioxidans]